VDGRDDVVPVTADVWGADETGAESDGCAAEGVGVDVTVVPAMSVTVLPTRTTWPDAGALPPTSSAEVSCPAAATKPDALS